MIKFFKRVFGFIRQNPAVLYSLFLIVFLPLVLWWNTSFTIKSFEKNIDLTLQKKALTVESILGEFISDKVSQLDVLQEKIDRISKENPEIKRLRVITYQDDKFKIVASQDEGELQRDISDPSLSLAWHQEQNIAHLVGTKEERFWKLIKPIWTEDGEKVALLSLALSLKNTDTLISRTAQFSYSVVIAAILVTLFLVLHHTRLFQYLKLYKELQRVDKMKDSFIRMAIHEVQTPIVNIRGYIEALKEKTEKLLSSAQKEDLSRISISAKNLSELIYDILAVVRIEQGALDFSPKKLFPQKVVEEIVESFKLKAKARNLSFLYRKSEGAFVINVNPNRFREVLTNLIENAIKYTSTGKIEVKEWIDEKKQRYYISFEDTGIGISGEEQRRLFERFYRIKSKETAGISGTGLGLWIVKNLCQQMGGDVTVESIKGVGSKFTISFPATKI